MRADAPPPPDPAALRAALLRDLVAALDAAEKRLFAHPVDRAEAAALRLDLDAFERLRAALAGLRAVALSATSQKGASS